MKNLLILVLAMLVLPVFSQNKDLIYKKALGDHNKKTIDNFFRALEQKDYQLLKAILDLDGKVISSNSASAEADTISGREAIGLRFEEVYQNFDKIKFEKDVNIMDDPSNLMVKTKGTYHSTNGEEIQTNFLATFKLKNGKIIEYVEYNNTILFTRRNNNK